MQVTDIHTGRWPAKPALKDFELVRIYHPDKADPTIPPEEAHARFQSIKTAYDTLREQTPLAYSSPLQDPRYPTLTAWRARSRHQELYARKNEDWKDHIILAGIVATIIILVSQVIATRRQVLKRAHHPNASSSRNPVALSTLDAQDPDRRLGE